MDFMDRETEMTPEEFRIKAQEIYDKYNGHAEEDGHTELDNLMYQCLKSLGYQEGLEILFGMNAIWYA